MLIPDLGFPVFVNNFFSKWDPLLMAKSLRIIVHIMVGFFKVVPQEKREGAFYFKQSKNWNS